MPSFFDIFKGAFQKPPQPTPPDLYGTDAPVMANPLDNAVQIPGAGQGMPTPSWQQRLGAIGQAGAAMQGGQQQQPQPQMQPINIQSAPVQGVNPQMVQGLLQQQQQRMQGQPYIPGPLALRGRY